MANRRSQFGPDKARGAVGAEPDYPHQQLTGRIIGAAMQVHNRLGPGFPETVYHEALKVELTNCSLPFDTERIFDVHYEGVSVGQFRVDLVVQDAVVVELKAIERLAPVHRQQVLSYLKASGLVVGLLLNFGTRRLEHQRVVNS